MIQTSRSTPTAYRLSFTAASLRPELARISAEAYLTFGNWDRARQHVLDINAFQSRTKSALLRMEREIRQRLECLTQDQLSLLAKGTADERVAITWLSIIKQAALVREFTIDILRGKLDAFDPMLRHSDYDNFISARLSLHPELAELKENSRVKIHRVMLLMLTEAGLLHGVKQERRIVRPVLTQRVIDRIVSDNAQLLAGFLWTDEEIAVIRSRA
jgi:hypothetical protein